MASVPTPSQPPAGGAPAKSSLTVVLWIIVVVLGIGLGGGLVSYSNSQSAKAKLAQQAQQKKAAAQAKAKAEEQRRKKEEQARLAAERKKQREAELAAAQARAEQERQPDPEPEPEVAPDETSGELVTDDSDEEPVADADDGGEEPAAEEEEPALALKEPGDKDARLYADMLKQAVADKDYAALRDKLKLALDEAYPGMLPAKAPAPAGNEEVAAGEGEGSEGAAGALLPNLPKKAAALTKSAISVYLCLDMALASPAADSEAQNAFCAWLLENKSKAATAFVQGLAKNKITLADDAAAMLDELRDFYAAEPKKAMAEIKRITNPIGDKVSKKLYPVTNTKDIDSQLAKILKNKDRGTPADQQDAINKLNAFRYLCGVSPDVVYDKEYAEQAAKAAAACRKNGSLSHDLGDFTDVCNLHSGSFGKMGDTVADYMRDPGDNNRERRGHRMWCLHPQLGKSGFGQAESFHAMRVTDLSAKKPVQTAYSYPGRGYFPVAYLDGDGWSYYAPSGVDLGSEVTVEMWRLNNSLKTKPAKSKLGKSNAVPIKASFPNGSFVVFEPDYDKMKKKKDKLSGTYWIRIKAGKFTDEYVVDLY